MELLQQESNCWYRPASVSIANQAPKCGWFGNLLVQQMPEMPIIGSFPPGKAWEHAGWQNSETVTPWQVSKWWCDGHPQAGRDLVPWQNVRKPVGHVLVMNWPVAACLAWLKILFPNALGKTCLGSIAEAMLFGILPPLLLSGALENPKLWVSSATTADFGGVLPFALDCGNLWDHTRLCSMQKAEHAFWLHYICDIM